MTSIDSTKRMTFRVHLVEVEGVLGIARMDFESNQGQFCVLFKKGSPTRPPNTGTFHKMGYRNKSARALALLFIRTFIRSDWSQQSKEDITNITLLKGFYEHFKRFKGKSSYWLHHLFTGDYLNTNNLPSYSDHIQKVGEAPNPGFRLSKLWSSDSCSFELWLHDDPLNVQEWQPAMKSNGGSEQLPPARYHEIAKRLEWEAPPSRQSTTRTKPEPIKIETLTILVDKEARGNWKAVDRHLLPLTSQDLFKLVIECNRVAHIYVAWVWSSGSQVTPLFPWLPMPEYHWRDPNANDRDAPRKRLTLTDDYKEQLKDDAKHMATIGTGGGETLVVLAHENRLDLAVLKHFFLQAVGKVTQPITFRKRDELEVIEIEIKSGGTTAMMGPAWRPEPAKGGLEELQEQLEHMPMRADACSALVIPTLGGK